MACENLFGTINVLSGTNVFSGTIEDIRIIKPV